MTVSNRLTSKCVQGLALVFALLALPLAGNLSANEAGSPKLEVTKKKSQDKDLKEIWKKLQAAVKAGKMTQKEADASKKKSVSSKTTSCSRRKEKCTNKNCRNDYKMKFNT